MAKYIDYSNSLKAALRFPFSHDYMLMLRLCK